MARKRVRLTITKEYFIDELEVERLTELIKGGSNILLINDVNGERHLEDWNFVKYNHIEEVIDRPLEENENVS